MLDEHVTRRCRTGQVSDGVLHLEDEGVRELTHAREILRGQSALLFGYARLTQGDQQAGEQRGRDERGGGE